MNIDQRLERISQSDAISGRENEMSRIKVISEMISALGVDFEVDSMGNIICCKKGTGKNKLLIITNYDECGFVVKKIDDKGFIKLAMLGNIDERILPGLEVIIHGSEKILGVIATKPPHLLTSDERSRQIKLKDILVDTGNSNKQLVDKVKIGDSVTIKSEFKKLLEGRFAGKFVSISSCVEILFSTMNLIRNEILKDNVYFVFTTSSEMNFRGISKILQKIAPQSALFLRSELAPSITNDPDEIILGNGPVILKNPVVSQKITEELTTLADKSNIPIQINVQSHDLLTPSHIAQTHMQGVPSALLSIPVKLSRASYEVVDERDIEYTSKLLGGFIKK